MKRLYRRSWVNQARHQRSAYLRLKALGYSNGEVASTHDPCTQYHSPPLKLLRLINQLVSVSTNHYEVDVFFTPRELLRYKSQEGATVLLLVWDDKTPQSTQLRDGFLAFCNLLIERFETQLSTPAPTQSTKLIPLGLFNGHQVEYKWFFYDQTTWMTYRGCKRNDLSANTFGRVSAYHEFVKEDEESKMLCVQDMSQIAQTSLNIGGQLVASRAAQTRIADHQTIYHVLNQEDQTFCRCRSNGLLVLYAFYDQGAGS
ncbi:hypothetical protein M8C21_009732 [Ambrosia artemisiifolia]|uniref:Uncharacterized protein n=1 Tax=Ambrosia artemisiifolia TaxID=4212 RepID=A0AAD5BWX8_AMBAR|nr:hypothetical protein M8C21_009732 [Ambrosia artemisiifolia]